ncbi:cytochrome P450 [Aspergillus heteromorphus CBS 117.55]|uniref:Cytochrome P450 n=1 Tax=Aspergillus heteromorphus CBS 117.55 TaxID=1448321 RepID=A0A317WG78_9EURO|nr:cytochrome P450 [Aspergillus heteromorphus CBS 117.55]PWY84975.1 cytochrome P450 [Aspergillus heteromorphus CBS 117.55]
MNNPLALTVGAVTGVVMHHGVFIHGEWHLQAPSILVGHVSVFAVLLLASTRSSWLLIAGYLLSLFASITIYRLFFHPLRHFPGPLGARISKLWHVWQARKCKNFLVLDALHAQYGDFVRTGMSHPPHITRGITNRPGPNELTIFHPDIYIALDGPKSHCIKAEWYDLLHPRQSLVTTRDKAIHAARRRQWNRGFTAKSLAQYEAKILTYIDDLDALISHDAAHQNTTEINPLFYWFGFDTMGDFVFNKSFDMLHRGEWHFVIVLLRRAMSILGPLSPVPWVVQIAFRLCPRVGILPANPTQTPDVAFYLLEDAKTHASQIPWLTGDSILAIVAGSEPTASTLIGIFCELARGPVHADRIYREIRTTGVDVNDPRALARECPHLEAVVAEALRLYPALLTGGYRKTQGEGMWMGGKHGEEGAVFVPPFTTVVAPRFSVMRREDCFIRASEFLPERWSDEPWLVRNRAAYAPFGTGI